MGEPRPRRERRGALGYDALIAGRDRDAIKWFSDAVRTDPANAMAWYDMGIAQGHLNHLHDAKTDFHRAATLEPTNKDYAGADKGSD